MLVRETVEIAPERRVRSGAGSPWKRLAFGAAAVLLLATLAAGGIAWATNDYAAKYEGRLLPGTVVNGVDVSGMTEAEALAAVKASIGPELTRRVVVTWRGRKWATTPRRLGARSDARRAVEAAMAASARATWLEMARMRWFGERLEFRTGVAVSHPRRGVKRFVSGIASGLYEEPVDAHLDYSSGWVEIAPDRNGRRVSVAKARAALSRALKRGTGRVGLPVRIIEPEVTAAAFEKVLLVRIGENKLYLYEDGEIAYSWRVATGQPEYMTPTGTYTVTEKRYLPTWINPAPDTWGADLPAKIPPGPDNPLGIRALNWSAPGIRFHGTEATYSLGFNASHGCVRLSNSDVVELYNLVDVGTPIVSLVAAPLKPLYAPAPDPTPVPDGRKGGKRDGDSTSGTGGAGKDDEKDR